MIRQRPWWQRALAAKLHWLWMKLENDGLADFQRNGEGWLIEGLLAFYASRGQGMRVLDVGANVGDYAALLLERAQAKGLGLEVHAFEPSPVAFARLKSRLGQDGRAVLVAAGASDKAGRADIHFDQAGSSLASLHARAGQGRRQSVRLLRLDHYLKKAGLGHLELLKVDVEGHELKALQGLGRALDPARIDLIQFEYGGTGLDAGTSLRQLYQLLEGAGFKLAKLMPGRLEPRAYDEQMENYLYANYVAYAPRMEAWLR